MPLPAKETQPMIALSRTASVTPKVSESTDARDRNSSMETSAAAPPPTPLNSATICGMAVIGTRRAAGTPSTVPTAMLPIISGKLVAPLTKNAAKTATTMPPAPIWLPRRAVLGPLRPRRARMKQTAAIRSMTAMTKALLIGWPALSHSPGWHPCRRHGARCPGRPPGADDGHAADGGAVQRRWRRRRRAGLHRGVPVPRGRGLTDLRRDAGRPAERDHRLRLLRR